MKRVFISYAHDDIDFKESLVLHLQILSHKGIITAWHDGIIHPGEDWQIEVERHLKASDIVIVLLSASFLASTMHQDHELAFNTHRTEASSVQIVPVLIRACAWELSAFSRLDISPSSGRPIAAWPHPDDAWAEVVRRVRTAAESTSPQAEPMTGTNAQLSAIRKTLLTAKTPFDVRLCLHQVNSVLTQEPNNVGARVLKDDVSRALARIATAAQPTTTAWGQQVAVLASVLLGIGISMPLALSECKQRVRPSKTLSAEFSSAAALFSLERASDDVCRKILLHDSTYNYSVDPDTGMISHHCSYYFAAGEAASVKERANLYEDIVADIMRLQSFSSNGSTEKCGREHTWGMAPFQNAVSVVLRADTCSDTDLPYLEVRIDVPGPPTPQSSTGSGPTQPRLPK